MANHEPDHTERSGPIFGSDESAYVQLPPELQNQSSLFQPRMSALAAMVAETGVVAGSIGGGKTAVEAGALLSDTRRKTIPITWALLVLATYVTSGGVLFAKWENWSLLDGCYFCYISLSTIGFGDLVPGRILAGDDDMYQVDSKQIICTIYLLIGMALVAMCFNLMQEEAIENLKAFWRSLGCFRNHRKGNKDKVRDRRRQSQAMFEELGSLEMRGRQQWDGRRSHMRSDHHMVQSSRRGENVVQSSRRKEELVQSVQRRKDGLVHNSRRKEDLIQDIRRKDKFTEVDGREEELPQSTEMRLERSLGRRSYNEQLNRVYREVAADSPKSSLKRVVVERTDDLNDVNAIIVSDYDREYEIIRSLDEFRKMSEIGRTKLQSSLRLKKEQMELKYYRDSKNKRWQKQDQGSNRS